jgi:hypothetical protein
MKKDAALEKRSFALLITGKEELKPGLVLFRRGDVEHRMWYCRMKMPKADRYKRGFTQNDRYQRGSRRPRFGRALSMCFLNPGRFN